MQGKERGIIMKLKKYELENIVTELENSKGDYCWLFLEIAEFNTAPYHYNINFMSTEEILKDIVRENCEAFLLTNADFSKCYGNGEFFDIKINGEDFIVVEGRADRMVHLATGLAIDVYDEDYKWGARELTRERETELN
jgi:hypothetical protein